MRASAIYQEPTEALGVRIRQSSSQALRNLAAADGQPYSRLIADAVELYLADRVEGHEPAISAPGVTQLGLDFEEHDAAA